MNNELLDKKLQEAEEQFRQILEQSLTSFLERQVSVELKGPELFEFKSFKAALPGEVLCVTLTATDGAPGKIQFILSRETAGMLGDLLLMGDGSAAFSHDDHLDPLRDFFREVVNSYAGILKKQYGVSPVFDDVKSVLADVSLADFVGTGWVASEYTLGLPQPQLIFRLTSLDFCEACFPDEGGQSEVTAASAGNEADDQEAVREMGLVMDIELPISIELGRTVMLIRDIIKLVPGSVVELDKLSGEPVDIMVNNRLFARGEVVVVDENFAVRVTELVTPRENPRAQHN
jgi:flagellar motor switch protein FliN